MTETKMDIKMAKWAVDNFDNKDAFPFEVEICEKCGAMYKPDLGHSCDETITVPVHKEGESHECK